MDFRIITRETLTEQCFQRMIEMENQCGLEPYTPEMLMDCVCNLITVGCFDGDILTGFVTVKPVSRYLGGSIYIVNLNVAPEYRRRGIGETLIRTACSHFAATGKRNLVTLDVAMDNTKALNLYKKMGFRVIDMPSRNGEKDIAMAMSWKMDKNRQE